jgi:hypothetical protein
MDYRCENGMRLEWHGGPGNDPDAHEVELGVCPDCCGRGCENAVDEQNLLSNLAQLIDSKRQEGCAWSEWDQQMRDDISRRLLWITTPPRRPYNEIKF